MYLSHLIVDTAHHQLRRDLGDCHLLHQRVLSAFPPAPDSARERFGVLYRVEPCEHGPRLLRLLVQSSVVPDWGQLPAGYLGPPPDGRANPAVRPLADDYARIHTGVRLRFRLRANPTKRLSDRTPGRTDPLLGKRVALLREDEQLAWLGRQAARCGFELVSVAAQPELADTRVSSLEQTRGRRPARDGADAMLLRFGAVLFEGRLAVTDAELFRAALAKGIGSAKAYGFGLLSIASDR